MSEGTMIATYSLSDKLPSFEFFSWLVMVQSAGATKICFDIDKPKLKNKSFSLADISKRFFSILCPGPALAGMDYHIGDTPTDVDAVAAAFQKWYEAGNRFKRLKTVKPPVACKYTVTIRDNALGARLRDSNRDVWERFALEIGATFIDDYYRDPISLHDRVALYAGSKMNFGVCNGPIFMASLTEYPVAMFVNGESARNSQTRFGMQQNRKYPWMLPNQHLIWQDDNDLGALLKTFEALGLT